MFETIDNAVNVNQDLGTADTCFVDRVMTTVGRARTSSRLTSATPDAPVVDRRTSVRHGRCGLPAARLRSGQALNLLNLSHGGLQAVSDVSKRAVGHAHQQHDHRDLHGHGED